MRIRLIIDLGFLRNPIEINFYYLIKTLSLNLLQILKLQRDKCSSILEFADSVTKALTLMELNLQREWLLEQLQELKWDG